MRTYTHTRAGFILLVFGLFAPVGFGSPVIEKRDRVEVNWSTLRLRFYGEAAPGRSDLHAKERQAWKEGLKYVTEAVRNLNIAANEAGTPNPDELSAAAKVAARRVEKSTFSYDTTYFADGSVRVHLENALPKALLMPGIRFHQKDAASVSMSEYTGLILQADKSVSPRATYQIVDETGAVLFDVHDMAEEAYRKNLMGRWFRQPTANELASAVGRSPIRIAATAIDGKFQVKRSDWEKALEGHHSLLTNGLVAIALP